MVQAVAISFERTFDLELVRSIITDPSIWPNVSDDNSGDPKDFWPTDHEAICYILARDEEKLIGMWSFVPHNSVCWEVHTYLLPNHGFTQGRKAAKELAAWIFANTKCQRIFTNVPEFNRAARIFAKAAGMKEFGNNPNSFIRNGTLWNQTLLGLSRS